MGLKLGILIWFKVLNWKSLMIRRHKRVRESEKNNGGFQVSAHDNGGRDGSGNHGSGIGNAGFFLLCLFIFFILVLLLFCFLKWKEMIYNSKTQNNIYITVFGGWLREVMGWTTH